MNMKILFISDIHGVPSALEKALAAAAPLNPDRVVLLGDLLYHGPRNGVPDFYDPVKVAGILNALKEKIVAVRGNCDAEVDQMMLEFPILSDNAIVDSGSKTFFLTHGHRWNPLNPPPFVENMVLAYGHTHIPDLRTGPGTLEFFNPGSISLPKNGHPPSFGFFDGEELRHIYL